MGLPLQRRTLTRLKGPSRTRPQAVFSLPEVAVHTVKLACEHPSSRSLPLARWDCAELARALVESRVVESISASTVRRILAANDLRPWLVHAWLSPQTPRDAVFCRQVEEICALYTRPLAANEAVFCVDEKTNLQPRRRVAPTLPAQPGKPVRYEHGYKRSGAVHLLGAFDTRTGAVIHRTVSRKRAQEFIAFLGNIDAAMPASIQRVHIVLDNLSVHVSRAVKAWLADHPRFVFHFPPVHCSWLNQIDQWFSILQRKLLPYPDFTGLAHLAEAISAFIARWNKYPHPFNWTSRSVTKVLAKCQLLTDFD